MKYIHFLILLFSTCVAWAQPSISPSLVSSAGNAGVDVGSPAFNVSWSVGEPCVTTLTNGNAEITQGFHQPLKRAKLKLDTLIISNSRCKTANNGWAKVKVKGGSGHYGYEWSPLSSDKDSLGPLPEGGYRVLVTDSVTSDTLSIFVKIELESQEDCDLTIYKGFSPNGDGKNDEWIIDGIDVFKKNEVTIFNRYGTVVYAVADYDNKTVVWKGEYQQKGTPLPDGTYYYIINLLEKPDNGRYKGWVEITK